MVVSNGSENLRNGIQMAYKKPSQKRNHPAAGSSAPDPVCDTFEIHHTFCVVLHLLETFSNTKKIDLMMLALPSKILVSSLCSIPKMRRLSLFEGLLLLDNGLLAGVFMMSYFEFDLSVCS